jgi:pimeloyl-ACP methyl ester carboxylesterase
VLWGKQDHLVPAAYAHEFVKLIKGAKVELIDKASHMLPIEQPAAAAKAVTDFVKR